MTIVISSSYRNRLANLEAPPELARNLRRADDFIRLAVVAGAEAMRSAQKRPVPAPSRSGLILGTAFGTMQTNFDVLDLIVSGAQTSPTLFSHSVFNAAAGYMASIFNLQGCALTITDFSQPFFRALQHGYMMLLTGRLESCLVLHVESYSALLQDGRERHAPGQKSWQPGAVCWLLELEDEGRSNSYHLESLSITDHSCEPISHLHAAGVMTVNGQKKEATDPLSVAMAMSDEIMAESCPGLVEFRVSGSGGEAVLRLQKESA